MFVLVEKKQVPDGMGGKVVDYSETTEFKALVTLNSSLLARRMEQSGVKDIYTAYVDKSFGIGQYNYFKRISDNAIFMVTSDPNDNSTPKMSNMNFKVFSAKKTTLPK